MHSPQSVLPQPTPVVSTRLLTLAKTLVADNDFDVVLLLGLKDLAEGRLLVSQSVSADDTQASSLLAQLTVDDLPLSPLLFLVSSTHVHVLAWTIEDSSSHPTQLSERVLSVQRSFDRSTLDFVLSRTGPVLSVSLTDASSPLLTFSLAASTQATLPAFAQLVAELLT